MHEELGSRAYLAPTGYKAMQLHGSQLARPSIPRHPRVPIVRKTVLWTTLRVDHNTNHNLNRRKIIP